ncbi:7969_t:CDS:2 [Cetraspora pellucida]|uniref:7969_t:CDS:1 n=1 Tax=Cetraspora pellucida TaxID=1433469 RepID=A0A9N8YX89_9GLOM|nr:7969_t:CDS:2 [Cetraspora pellucida]
MELFLSLNNDKGGNSQLVRGPEEEIPQPPDNKKTDKLGRPPSPLLQQDLSQNNYVTPPPPYSASNNNAKTTTENSLPESTTKSTDGLPDFDELERRFEALKRK